MSANKPECCYPCTLETPKHHSITLKSLHWLKVPQCIHYQIVPLAFSSLQTSQWLSYICQLLTQLQPTRPTHSSSSCLSLSCPSVSSSVKVPALKNLHHASSLDELRKDLHHFIHPSYSHVNLSNPRLLSLSLSSAAFYSRLKTDSFMLSAGSALDRVISIFIRVITEFNLFK